jgi:hypothetical protein
MPLLSIFKDKDIPNNISLSLNLCYLLIAKKEGIFQEVFIFKFIKISFKSPIALS